MERYGRVGRPPGALRPGTTACALPSRSAEAAVAARECNRGQAVAGDGPCVAASGGRDALISAAADSFQAVVLHTSLLARHSLPCSALTVAYPWCCSEQHSPTLPAHPSSWPRLRSRLSMGSSSRYVGRPTCSPSLCRGPRRLSVYGGARGGGRMCSFYREVGHPCSLPPDHAVGVDIAAVHSPPRLPCVFRAFRLWRPACSRRRAAAVSVYRPRLPSSVPVVIPTTPPLPHR